MNITKRDITKMILLLIVTLGLYLIYWAFVTTKELNQLGARIPTALLFIIPFANFYFMYKFAAAFAQIVVKDEKQTVAYFLLLALLMPIGAVIYQVQMNKN